MTTIAYGQENSSYIPECTVNYDHLGQDENSLNRCSGCLTATDEGDKAIALRIYLIRKSDGSGTPFDEEYIDELFKQLDIHYSQPFGIHFLNHCVTYIDDDSIYNFGNPEGFQRAVAGYIGGAGYFFHESPDALPFLNLAIHGGYDKGGGANIYGNYAGAGYGLLNEDTGKYYPRAIMHEIGHVLGLFHTHRQNRHNPDFTFVSRNEEFVNGLNCCTTGDYVCDTPADPGICDQRAVFDNCNWSNPDMLTDSNGDVYVNVDPKNIMSYCGRADCFDTYFSSGQGERLHCTLSDPRTDNIQRPNAIISEQVAIHDDMEFDTDIKILDGGTLFIVNSTVTMQGGRKIQVEPGGRLVVSGGTITSTNDTGCETDGSLWKGIELMNAPDGPDFVEFDRALVKLSSATLSNMERGVYYGSNVVEQPVLGRISTFDSHFINNKTSINLVNGFLNNSSRNQVKHNVFVRTNFTIDESFPGGLATEGLGDAVRTAYGVPIDFYGCEFSIPDVNADIAAVNSIVTRVSMVNFCVTPGCEDITDAAGTPMKVKGYPVGVSLMMADGSRIKNTQFIDNKVAVDAVATSRLNLTRNIFSGEASSPGKGVVNLSESPDFIIDLNEFINEISNPANTEPAIALKISKSGVADALVMNNSFQDYTDAAIYFAGVNGNEFDNLEGAKIYCNTFANKLIPSLGVEPSDIYVDNEGVVAETQGSNLSPAGNEFSPNFSHAGSSIKNGSIGSVKTEISYFYSDVEDGQRDSEPLNSNNTINLPVLEDPSCLEQRPNVVTGNENITLLVTEIIKDIEDWSDQTTNVPFGQNCYTCKARVLDGRNNLFLVLDDWLATIEGDTSLTDKETQLSLVEGYRLGSNEKTLSSVNRSSRYGSLSGSVSALSSMVNDFSASGKGVSKSLDHIDIAKKNESEVIAENGNLFLATASQRDNFKTVAQAVSSAGSEYARRVLDFYYGIDVLGQLPEGKNIESAFSGKIKSSTNEDMLRGILIFPNPVHGGVLNLKGLENGRVKADVLSPFGRVVASAYINGNSGSINVGDLKSGIYYLKFNFENGDSEASKIIIK